MLEERLTEYFTLVSRYRRAMTDTSRKTITAELKELHTKTSSTAVRLKTSTFLSSIGAWGKAS